LKSKLKKNIDNGNRCPGGGDKNPAKKEGGGRGITGKKGRIRPDNA